MPFTYILRCADGSYYVGSTRGDLADRVHQHAIGTGSRYTACRRPVELVWFAEFERVTEAFALEKQVQNWSRAKREALIEGRFADLPGLSRSRGRRESGLDKLDHPRDDLDHPGDDLDQPGDDLEQPGGSTARGASASRLRWVASYA